MNDEAARQGRPANASGGYDCSDRRGRRAPALVIRLEVGQALSVVADWDNDEGDVEFTNWLDECRDWPGSRTWR